MVHKSQNQSSKACQPENGHGVGILDSTMSVLLLWSIVQIPLPVYLNEERNTNEYSKKKFRKILPEIPLTDVELKVISEGG